jgi:hypothetical protein
MPLVEIFTTPNERAWKPIIDELESRGYRVNIEYVDADVAIVLGGRYNNPILWNKKILFYNHTHWGNLWHGMYEDVVRKYYDRMVDATSGTLEGIVDTIIAEFDRYSVSPENGIERTR